MALVIVTGAPFCLAVLLAMPFVKTSLSKTAQTLLTASVMAVLFVWLLSTIPNLQAD